MLVYYRREEDNESVIEEMKKSPPLCIDCEYYSKEYIIVNRRDTSSMSMSSHFCYRRRKIALLNVVTGELETDEEPLRCETQRVEQRPSRCGIHGRFFKNKNSGF